MTLGEIIKNYRTEHDMSMDAFAAKSGMSKAYISLLEKNQHPKTGKPITPSIKAIKQAADGMGIDFNTLFNMLDGDVALSDQKQDEDPFYLDDEARELIEFIHDNPKYKLLFDASRKIKAEDIDFVRQMIERFSE